MKSYKEVVLLFILMMVIHHSNAVSQSMWGINYLGEHRFRGGARDRALGFSSLALADTSHNVVTANPSSLANIEMVTFSLFQSFSMNSMSTSDNTVDQNRFVLPSITLAVPLPKGLVISTGYHTRFESRGEFSFPGTKIPEASRPYSHYNHRSSLFTAPLALGWNSAEWLNMSLELQIERGSVKDDITNTLGMDGGEVESSWYRDFSALSWAAAMEVKPRAGVSLGFYYDAQVDYSVEEEFLYSRESLDSTATSDFTLPPCFGIGAALEVSDRWRVMSSYWWREAPHHTSLNLFEGSLSDEWLFGIGVERLRDNGGGFFDRIPIRVGFYQNRWHLQFPAGETLTGSFATFGTGFSLPGGPGYLDISLETGQIGSLENNNLSERVIKLGIGFSLAEPWSRRKEDRP